MSGWAQFSARLLFQRVDRLRDRPAPQACLAQRDKVLKREAGDPRLPVTDGVETPNRVGGRLGVELMIAPRQVTARRVGERSMKRPLADTLRTVDQSGSGRGSGPGKPDQIEDSDANAISLAMEARRAALAGKRAEISRRASLGLLGPPDAGRRCSAVGTRKPSSLRSLNAGERRPLLSSRIFLGGPPASSHRSAMLAPEAVDQRRCTALYRPGATPASKAVCRRANSR
jgi:hypothetical protein